MPTDKIVAQKLAFFAGVRFGVSAIACSAFSSRPVSVIDLNVA